MIKLTASLQSWGDADFSHQLKNEIQAIAPALLPLQQGLSHSSVVSDSAFSVTILNVADKDDLIEAKVGVFYTGIIAGCNCADDPSPIDEQNEYCEVLLSINKYTAETTTALLNS